MRRALVATAIVAATVAAPVRGQNNRAQLISSGVDAYANFQPQRALQLLGIGMDPSLGELDSLWGVGVQTLVQILLEQRQDSLASLWARWVVRQVPSFTADSVNFLPTVGEAFRRARSATADPRDVEVETTWRWAAASDLRAPGSVRALAGQTPAPVQLLVVGMGVVRAGDSLALPPGSYQFHASADGFVPAQIAREILPGVQTMLSFNLLAAAAGFLSVATKPWGTVFVDGRRVGYSPVLERRLAAGPHQVLVQRDGYASADTTVQVERDARVRLALRLERQR